MYFTTSASLHSCHIRRNKAPHAKLNATLDYIFYVTFCWMFLDPGFITAVLNLHEAQF